MGTTPKYLLPYPELTDVANVPADMRELSEAVELALTPYGSDTAWVDGGTGATIIAANATNITLTKSLGRRIGSRVQILLEFTMKVVSNMPASGDVSQLEIGTLATAWRSTAPCQQPLASVGAGRTAIGMVDQVAPSKVYVTSIGGSVALAVGEVVSLGGSYLIN